MNRMTKEGWHFISCLICKTLLIAPLWMGAGLVCKDCGKGISKAKRIKEGWSEAK